jgi:uncharacterized protein (TIGR00730 family)
MSGPEKSYKNQDFLNSTDARAIRILCEYEEPRQRFEAEGVEDTIVMFGSARTLPEATAKEQLASAEADLAACGEGPERAELQEAVLLAGRNVRSSRFYEETRELARRLTEWSMSRSGMPDYLVCTGGGPGIMEAGNRGAADVVGGRSVGLGISLPFEEKVNRFVTPSLGFEFHYFFTRKYWFMYFAKAMVVCPGGFGTLDEFMELLTLIQTQKITKPMPIILFGSAYWNSILNIEAMVEWGTISRKDLDLFCVIDTVDEAFEYLTAQLVKIEGE